MKNVRLTGVISGVLCLFILCVSTFNATASELKVMVVNIQEIMTKSKIGKDIMEQIKSKHETMRLKWENKKKEIDALKKELEETGAMMSKDARTNKERDFRIKAMDFERMTKELNKKSQEVEFIETRKLYEKIKKVAEKIAAKEGIDIVMDHRQAGVLYFNQSLDITKKLIKQLDAENKK